jgi:hypothetical protein
MELGADKSMTSSQSLSQSSDPFWWRFKPGQSGNPLGPTAARRLKLEAKCRELAAEFGGWDGLSVVEKTMIDQAAALLVRRRPAGVENMVRCANAVARLLHVVERSRGKGCQKAEAASLGALLSADLARAEPAGASSMAPASDSPPEEKRAHGSPQSDGEASGGPGEPGSLGEDGATTRQVHP